MVSDVASKGQTGFSLPVAVSDQVDMSQGRRYLKPGWFVSWMVNPLLMRLGAVPTLAVLASEAGRAGTDLLFKQDALAVDSCSATP